MIGTIASAYIGRKAMEKYFNNKYNVKGDIMEAMSGQITLYSEKKLEDYLKNKNGDLETRLHDQI